MAHFSPKEIRRVYEKDCKNPAAQNFYADSLNAEMWTAQKDGKPAAQPKPLAELVRLVQVHPENDHVAEAYCDALVSRCIAMGLTDERNGIAELRKTLVTQQQTRPDNRSIAQSTALVMMATWGVGDSAAEPLVRQTMNRLYQKHAGDEVIDDAMNALKKCTAWALPADDEGDTP